MTMSQNGTKSSLSITLSISLIVAAAFAAHQELIPAPTKDKDQIELEENKIGIPKELYITKVSGVYEAGVITKNGHEICKASVIRTNRGFGNQITLSDCIINKTDMDLFSVKIDLPAALYKAGQGAYDIEVNSPYKGKQSCKASVIHTDTVKNQVVLGACTPT